MYLKRLALFVIIGMTASFSLRIFGTVFPQIFLNIIIVKATILINAVFMLIHLLFWLVFYLEYISVRKAALKKMCFLVIIGCCAVLAIYLKKILFVLGMNFDCRLLLMNPYFDALAPLFSSAFHLIFFITFKKSLSPDEQQRLTKPILSIVLGTAIFIVLHATVLINFLATCRFEWLEHMPRIVAVSTVPLIIIAVSCILYFYYGFYSFLDSGDNFETENRHSS